MKLFKYEGYKITISEEAFSLKPFRMIWNRDRSKNKEKAMLELSYIYFMVDPRSDYQYLVDEDARSEAIKEAEGFADKWQPDKLVKEAMEFYATFKPASALLLEDTRLMVDKFRQKMRDIDFEELTVKELKEVGALIKQIPGLVKDLDDAEKALAAEIQSQAKMRGQGQKTIFEDSLTL